MICLYYITLRCNDTCEFCQIWQNSDHQNIRESDKEEILPKLREIKRRGAKQLSVTGGEPLLREDLPEILKAAKELGFAIDLTTNCILYPERAKALRGLVNTLYFSLDYPLAEEHDRSRGLACFNTVLRSIRLAQELGEEPVIFYTLTRDSVRYLPEMVEIAEKLGVPIFLNPVYDLQGLQGFEEETLTYIKYFFKRPNVILNLAALELIKRGGNNPVWPRCRAKETVITLMPDGQQVTPCFFNSGGKQGREAVCSGCTRWPYMLPSFAKGLDYYYLLNLYSDWYQNRKENVS
jgi:MoaA/NifB/PqqE/SkfB family radical SAM enzyme